MQFDTFLMERNQTRFENGVEINLTESGVHPCTIEEILPGDEAQALLRQPLGYGWTDGRPDLRAAIASWYPGASASNVLVTNGSSEATMITLFVLPLILAFAPIAVWAVCGDCRCCAPLHSWRSSWWRSCSPPCIRFPVPGESFTIL